MPIAPQESHEDGAGLEKGYSREGRETQSGHAKRRRERTHLPPAVAIKIISEDDLDALARTKGNLVFVLRDKVVSSVDVFHHGKCCERGDAVRDDGARPLSIRGKK